MAEAQDLFAPAYQVSEAAGKLFGYGGIVGVSQTVTAAAMAFGTASLSSSQSSSESLDLLDRTASTACLVGDTGSLMVDLGSKYLSPVISSQAMGAFTIFTNAAGVVGTGVELVRAASYVSKSDYTLASLSLASAAGVSLVAFAGGPIAAGVGAALALSSGLVGQKVKDIRSDVRHNRILDSTFEALPKQKDELAASVLCAAAAELEMDPTDLIDLVADLEETQVQHLVETAHQLFGQRVGQPPAEEAIDCYIAVLTSEFERATKA